MAILILSVIKKIKASPKIEFLAITKSEKLTQAEKQLIG